MLTGRLCVRSGTCGAGWLGGVFSNKPVGGLPTSEITFATALKGVGYTTAAMGKCKPCRPAAPQAARFHRALEMHSFEGVFDNPEERARLIRDMGSADAALLENHQDHDGVAIPKALVPYVGFDRIDA